MRGVRECKLNCVSPAIIAQGVRGKTIGMKLSIPSELNQRAPRAVARRADAMPWLTWEIGWKMLVCGLASLGLSWLCWRFVAEFAAVLPLTLGVLLAICGFWFSVCGLVGAHDEINRHKFLVSHGHVAIATLYQPPGYQWVSSAYYYYFRDHNGQLIRDCATLEPLARRHRRRLVPGYRLVVLYSPRNSKHHVVYEAATYQALALSV